MKEIPKYPNSTNRTILLLLILFSSCFIQAQDKPNIVFILADDLGWKDLNCYGSDYYETPNLDALAASGMLFTDAYSANPLCSPTRASILTGQTPGRLRFTSASGHVENVVLDPVAGSTNASEKKNGSLQSRTRLPLEYITFAEVLNENGYATAFMGKWHIGRDPYLPENQGFDRVVGGREHSGPPGPGNYFSPWNLDNFPVVPQGTHIADMLTDEAMSYIGDHKQDPFLLCLWYYDVHAPFMAKESLKTKYANALNDTHNQRSPTMGAMIETMDQNIGRLLNYLKDNNLEDNTIIIFSSDNGGNNYNLIDETNPTNNLPLRAGKGNNYEGGVRVPMIVRAPGITNAGTVSNVVTQSVDHYPTMLELLDIPYPDQVTDGHSYLNALKGQTYDREPMFSVFMHDVPATANRYNTSVRLESWKLYKFYHDGPNREHRYELYNLSEDIGETNNLAEAMPSKTIELATLITNYESEADLLIPLPNASYAGNSEAGWFSNRGAVLTLKENILVLESKGVAPYIETNHVPNYKDSNMTFVFDLKSASKGIGKVLWTTNQQNTYSQSTTFSPTHDNQWHTYEVAFPLVGDFKSLRLQPSSFTGTIEIKNIKLLSDDGYLLRDWSVDALGIVAGISENEAPEVCAPVDDWEFDDGLACWVLHNHLEGEVSESALNLTITGNDPILYAPTSLQFEAANYSKIIVRMKNQTPSTNSAMYFTTDIDPSFAGNFILFPISANDTEMQAYEIDMSAHEDWNSTITKIRFDPIQPGVDGTMAIDYIGIIPNEIEEPPIVVLSVNETKAPIVTVYPNPSKAEVKIVLNSYPSEIFIHDINGRLVYSKYVNMELSILTREIGTKGLYFISVNGFKQKLIIE